MDREQPNTPRELISEELDLVAGGVLLITGQGKGNLNANSPSTPAAQQGLQPPKDHGAFASI